jgi:Flp pilus assembly protein TadD
MDNRSNQLQQYFMKGSLLLQSGNARQAILCFQNALAIDPSNPTLLLYTGTALHDVGRYEEAVTSYKQAIQIAPTLGEAHNNLGNSLLALGQFAEAADSFSVAIELLPESPVSLVARATALQAMGKVAEAEVDCRRALLLAPSFAAAHWNLALNLLLQGRYAEGWQEYEWRWKKPDFTSPVRHADVPMWDGSPLEGKTILLHAEQGFGDAIQFVRYATMIAACGGDVLLECHPQLVSLFQGVEGVRAVIPFGHSLPPLSFQLPLLSLPRIFGTNLQTIPSHFPYLSIPVEYHLKWAAVMPTHQKSLKIGLVWAGKSYPDPLRSCPLAEFAPLSALNATFYSLQLAEGPGQSNSSHGGMPLIDLTDNINDFADTAALIEHLDLIISIDTAVAHLAGALGKPVCLILPFAPDWRWLLDRNDSPWYQSTRIFRQKQPGNWEEVIRRVFDAVLQCTE